MNSSFFFLLNTFSWVGWLWKTDEESMVKFCMNHSWLSQEPAACGRYREGDYRSGVSLPRGGRGEAESETLVLSFNISKFLKFS